MNERGFLRLDTEPVREQERFLRIQLPGYAHKGFCCQESGSGFAYDTLPKLLINHQAIERLSYQTLEQKIALVAEYLRDILKNNKEIPIQFECHSLGTLVGLGALNSLSPEERVRFFRVVLFAPVPFGNEGKYATSLSFNMSVVGVRDAVEVFSGLTCPEQGAKIPVSTAKSLFGEGCSDSRKALDSVGTFWQLWSGRYKKNELALFLKNNKDAYGKVHIIGFTEDACHPPDWVVEVAQNHGLTANLQMVPGGHCGWKENTINILNR